MANLCHKCFFEYDTPGSCPSCGYDATADLGKYPLSLPAGSILDGRYIVGRVLGEGGFGITYSAQDYDSKGLVAIKEHFPAAIVTRTDRRLVSLISENMKDAFTEGKEKFLAEAKTISQFNGLPNICDIYSYFEENGTAYFAMEYVNGIPLDKYMEKLGRLPNFEETTRLLLPVMEALSHVHEKGIIHRDIAPDNIMVSPDTGVMLIDFGAARYSMGEKSRSLDVILKHGFAPREQYNRHGRQGAYTDVYAMAATYYYVLTGKVPQDALDRLDDDRLLPPSKLGISIPRRAEQALMKALAVTYTQRFQSMREFAEALKKELPPDKAELERQRQLKLEEEKRRQAELEAKRKAEEEHRAAEKKALEAKREAERKAKEAQRAEAQRLKELKKTEKAEKAGKTAESKTPKKKKPLALIAALAAVAIGAGAFFAMGGDKAEIPVISDAPLMESAEPQPTETPAPTAEPSNIAWEYNEDNKTLTISGEGEMEDWYGYGDNDNIPPWQLQWRIRAGTENIVIEEGITHIGAYAFSGYSGLKSVTIPVSVTSISGRAFQLCSNIEAVNYSGTKEQWKEIAIADTFWLPESMRAETMAKIDWELSGDTLTIRGEGEMESYTGYGGFNPAPWCVDGTREYIKKVVISPGITHVSGLLWLENMEEVELSNTVVFLGYDTFFQTPSLRTIIYNGTREQWDAAELGSGWPLNVDVEVQFTVLASGECGENLCWSLFEDGTLTISGEGEMEDFGYFAWLEEGETYSDAAPWARYRKEICKIVVCDGVSSIGSNAFLACEYATEVELPQGIERIGTSAFEQCRWLQEIYLHEGLITIDERAFDYCLSLESVVLPSSLRHIRNMAFGRCSDITSVEFLGTYEQWSDVSVGGSSNDDLITAVHWTWHN